MSGPIRKLLGPTKARLQGYLKNSRVIFMTPINDKDLDKEETEIEDLVHRVDMNVALLERCDNDWKTLLKELKGDSKAKVETEEKEYLWAAEGEDGFIELLLDSREVSARLQARLKKIFRLQERAEREASREAERAEQRLPKEPLSGGQPPNLPMKLPKLTLPTFDGNVLRWQEFWDVFNTAVHQQTAISDVTKFSYLKGSLKGSAASVIYGISVTNDNYPVVIGLLQEKFGKREHIVEALYSQLQHLTTASNRFTEVKNTYEAVEKIIRQLESQKEDIGRQQIVVQQILSKFPLDVIVKLEESKEISDVWTVASLRQSLKKYISIQSNAQRYEALSKPSHFKGHKSFKPVSTVPVEGHLSAEALVVNSKQKGVRNKYSKGEPFNPCVYCKGCHFSDSCDKCVTIDSRKGQLVSQGRCFICLKIGHTYRQCPSAQSRSCYHCKQIGHHHRSICPRQFNISCGSDSRMSESSDSGASQSANLSTSLSTGETGNSIVSTSNNVSLSHTLLATGERVLLQTAKVTVCGSNGCKVSAYLLLDSGSQRTFMTKQLATKLKLSSLRNESLSVSTFGGTRSQNVNTHVVSFSVDVKDGPPIVLCANVLPQITGAIQRGPLLQSDLDFLRTVSPDQLADSVPEKGSTFTIDLLVGSDYLWDIVGKDRVVLPSGLLLLSSRLGYIITGRFYDHTGCDKQIISSCAITSVADNHCLSDLWNLDRIGISESFEVKDDDKALEQFNNTVCYKEGRYFVTWPWKPNIDLPERFDVAYGRMRSLSRRLQHNHGLLEQYCDVIESQLRDGIIEIVDERSETENRKHYLPHHPVITPSKSTTKMRIVYDASVKAGQHEKSLNECLYRGPIRLPDLCGVLLRFRTYFIAILSDIEKAFLQVGIQESERDVTRFLWFKDPTRPDKVKGNLSVYRFCRVPFGIVCSPFLLEATLQYHLMQEGSDISKLICGNIYVDNVSLGADSVQEACCIYKEARTLFRKASMNLREWASNCKQFLDCLPVKERSTGTVMKVFGLLWNNVEDYLHMCGPQEDVVNCMVNVTKRSVVSSISKVYDPLGFVTPVTFFGKVFLQSLWTNDLNWDDCLTPCLLQEWGKIVEVLSELPELRIPRYVCDNVQDAVFQIFTFCDASAKSYATTVYLRVVCQHAVMVNLIFSKMRLSPLGNKKKKGVNVKPLSLPRLELLAVLIGTRATKFVVEQLRLCVTKKVILTDSQCVLHWIKSDKQLPVFVQNRVDEIRQLQDVGFGFIPSQDNPADCATRGLSVSEIKESKLWWHGPPWLQSEERNWPSWNLPDITSDDLNQLFQQANSESDVYFETANVVQEVNREPVCAVDETRYSTLRKLLRVTAFF